MYNINQLKNYATILKSGKETFWASDFGFSGGEINGLKYDFIEPTGNTRKELLGVGGNDFKKVVEQEWRLRTNVPQWRKEKLNKTITELCSVANMLRELGY